MDAMTLLVGKCWASLQEICRFVESSNRQMFLRRCSNVGRWKMMSIFRRYLHDCCIECSLDCFCSDVRFWDFGRGGLLENTSPSFSNRIIMRSLLYQCDEGDCSKMSSFLTRYFLDYWIDCWWDHFCIGAMMCDVGLGVGSREAISKMWNRGIVSMFLHRCNNVGCSKMRSVSMRGHYDVGMEWWWESFCIVVMLFVVTTGGESWQGIFTIVEFSDLHKVSPLM